MIIYNIVTAFRTFDVLILLITHYNIAAYSIILCYLIYFMLMQSLMVAEGSVTCITVYFAYVMRQSCKSIEVKKVHNKQFYKNSIRYIFGSLLLLDILIFSYDFGTATFQHVILPNGHCSFYGQTVYTTMSIAQAHNTINKVIQITLLVVYFTYYYKLNKMLKMVRILAASVDHPQNRLFFKLAVTIAVTMAAIVEISQIFFAYNWFIKPLSFVGSIGTHSLLIQQCVITFLFTASKTVLQLFKERFCTTGTSS